MNSLETCGLSARSDGTITSGRGTPDDGNDQDERLRKHEHYRRSRKADLGSWGRRPGPVVPGASCTGVARSTSTIVNRLSGFPVVDGIWHEPCSCFL